MNIFSRLFYSMQVAGWALFPPRAEKDGDRGDKAAAHSSEYLEVERKDIRYYLVDLNRAVNRRQELRLHFPGCCALAAPFLLFRLKRWGFSNGRAVKSDQGLFLAASR